MNGASNIELTKASIKNAQEIGNQFLALLDQLGQVGEQFSVALAEATAGSDDPRASANNLSGKVRQAVPGLKTEAKSGLDALSNYANQF